MPSYRLLLDFLSPLLKAIQSTTMNIHGCSCGLLKGTPSTSVLRRFQIVLTELMFCNVFMGFLFLERLVDDHDCLALSVRFIVIPLGWRPDR